MRRGRPHVRGLGDLQVAVGVVGMGMSAVHVVVPVSMAAVALMEEEGEHAQETKLGVHVDSHGPLASGPLQRQGREAECVSHFFFLSCIELRKQLKKLG